ncbi:unnamed protein product, partial [Pylaiella littoralis]
MVGLPPVQIICKQAASAGLQAHHRPPPLRRGGVTALSRTYPIIELRIHANKTYMVQFSAVQNKSSSCFVPGKGVCAQRSQGENGAITVAESYMDPKLYSSS